MNRSRIPNLVVNFSLGRIRVPKASLRMIGCPDYVRLFINTEEKYVAISPGVSGDALSNRVPGYIYSNTRRSYVIHSLVLVRELLDYCRFEADTRKCELQARACLDEQFVIFSFPGSDIS